MQIVIPIYVFYRASRYQRARHTLVSLHAIPDVTGGCGDIASCPGPKRQERLEALQIFDVGIYHSLERRRKRITVDQVRFGAKVALGFFADRNIFDGR